MEVDFSSLIIGGMIGFISSMGITWFNYFLQKTGKIRVFMKVDNVYDFHDNLRIDLALDFSNNSFSPRSIRNPQIYCLLKSEKSYRSNIMFSRNNTPSDLSEENISIITSRDSFDETDLIEIPPRSIVRKNTSLFVWRNKLSKNELCDLYNGAKISINYKDEKNRSRNIKAGELNL